MLEFLESLAGLFGFSGTTTTQPKPPRPPQTDAILCVDCDKKLEERLRPPSCITFQKLRAGNFPSEFEASQVLQLLEEGQEDINQYDAEIACLETMLAKHKEGRANALRDKEYARGLLAPIRKLPLEVLTIIFDNHCKDHSLLIEVAPARRISTPALDLAQTCNLWRNLALSRPSLWSHLKVDLEYNEGRILELVDAHLHYSQLSPLNLHIEARKFYGEGHPWRSANETYEVSRLGPNAAWLLQRLLFLSSRWQTVSLRLNRRLFLAPEFALWSDPAWLFPLPLLEVFQFMESDPFPAPDLFFANLLRHTPVLHTVKLDDLHTSIYPALPLRQIRTFQFAETVSPTKLPDLLKDCVHLESLDIMVGMHVETTLPGVLATIPITKSTSLQSLTLDIRHLGYTRVTCSRLVLPSLVTLKLIPTLSDHEYDSDSDSEVDDSPAELLQCLAEMLEHCTLKSLILDSCMFTSEELQELFLSIPSLIHLSVSASIQYLSFTDLFKALTWTKSMIKKPNSRPGKKPSKPVLLPHLEFLELCIIESVQRRKKLPSPQWILSLIESRRQNAVMWSVSGLDTDSKSYHELSRLSLRVEGYRYFSLGPTWAQKFYSEVYPRLRKFDGLVLELDLPV
ncbi:hypothetical protein VKT23_006104 [Stygiomarasmius scandens]|uniref:F-box domain-containing protein n=1 Tax=Marasmiellus scandens TaxID=2682957 RepID=A0ABR1JTX9_9AGAR